MYLIYVFQSMANHIPQERFTSRKLSSVNFHQVHMFRNGTSNGSDSALLLTNLLSLALINNLEVCHGSVVQILCSSTCSLSLKLVFVLIGWISTYVFRFVCSSYMLMFSCAVQL